MNFGKLHCSVDRLRLTDFHSAKNAAQRLTMQTAVRRDIEAAIRRPDGSDSDDDEKETPEMNLTVAISVLIASTGLTC